MTEPEFLYLLLGGGVVGLFALTGLVTLAAGMLSSRISQRERNEPPK